MRSFIKFVVPLFLVLNGCATFPIRPELPTSLDGKGVVIGEPIKVGVRGSFLYNDVVINGWNRGMVGAAHFAIALSPGEYTLDSFRSRMLNVISTLPIKRKFTIRPGEVTNLGQILLVYDPEDLGRQRYYIFAADNTEDTKHFLKTFYPQLFASLGPNSIKLGLDKYVSGNALTELRKHIAAQSVYFSKHYVVGPAGTLGKIKRDNQGKRPRLELVPSPTMSGIEFTRSDDQKDRFVFITTGQRLFSIRAGTVQQRTMPAAENLKTVFIAGDQDIILCYGGFKLRISNNDGQTWHAFDGAAAKGSECTSDALIEDASGYFLYRTDPAKILYAPYGASVFQTIELPEGVDSMIRLTVNPSKFFVEPTFVSWTAKTPKPLFVRDRKGGEWSKKVIPRSMCDPLKVLDDAGMSLQITCNKEILKSNDGGTTWNLQ